MTFSQCPDKSLEKVVVYKQKTPLSFITQRRQKLLPAIQQILRFVMGFGIQDP